MSNAASRLIVDLLLGLGTLWLLVMLLLARIHHYAQVSERDRWRR